MSDVERFRSLPSRNWYGSNSGTAYNAESMFTRASDRVTNSLINLLEKGADQYKVN